MTPIKIKPGDYIKAEINLKSPILGKKVYVVEGFVKSIDDNGIIVFTNGNEADSLSKLVTVTKVEGLSELVETPSNVSRLKRNPKPNKEEANKVISIEDFQRRKAMKNHPSYRE
jgi:hypothetical protein